MRLGHFDYLLSEPTTKVAGDRLEIFAKTAAQEFLNRGVPLNESISKAAQANDLNRNQIERLCEMANLATHQALWSKTAQKANVAFPLADPKKIAMPQTTTKTASFVASTSGRATMNDYLRPPARMPAAGPSIKTAMRVEDVRPHNGLHEVPEKVQLKVAREKLLAKRARLQDKLVSTKLALESIETMAFGTVKQAVMQEGYSMADLYRAACSVGLEKQAREYLPTWEKRLIGSTTGTLRLRLEKTAISRAPKDLIAEALKDHGVTVVNGAHPVLVSLDTIRQRDDEIRQGLIGLLRLNDEIELTEQKIRELS